MRKKSLFIVTAAAVSASAASAEQRTYINPIDVDYRYNFEQINQGVSYRTGADPVIVNYHGDYYLFMTLADGYWRSTDLMHWQFITPSRWAFGGVVAPAAWVDGDRLILMPSISFTRPGSILVTTAPETGKLRCSLSQVESTSSRHRRSRVTRERAARRCNLEYLATTGSRSASISMSSTSQLPMAWRTSARNTGRR